MAQVHSQSALTHQQETGTCASVLMSHAASKSRCPAIEEVRKKTVAVSSSAVSLGTSSAVSDSRFLVFPLYHLVVLSVFQIGCEFSIASLLGPVPGSVTLQVCFHQ